MAVFTAVAEDALARWLSRNYGVALAGAPRPIAAGIENSNYEFAAADGARYVLTILEVWDAQRAAYCLALAAHLADKKNPAPRPLLRTSAKKNQGREFAAEWRDGKIIKPAAVLPFVQGAAANHPSAEQCRIAGQTLARLHLDAADFPLKDMHNPRDAKWREQAAKRVYKHLSAADCEMLADELAAQKKAAAAGLPRAACHCDFFRDNVLWRGANGATPAIAGVIDFYFSGEDDLIFDLAVAANDWCADGGADFKRDKLCALLDGYQSRRMLSPAERAAFPLALRAAALRFWLSRLVDFHYPRLAKNLTPHNPDIFRDILAARRKDANNSARFAVAAPRMESRAVLS